MQGTVAPPKHLRETLNLTETPALLLNLRLETGLQSKERNVASGRGEAERQGQCFQRQKYYPKMS